MRGPGRDGLWARQRLRCAHVLLDLGFCVQALPPQSDSRQAPFERQLRARSTLQYALQSLLDNYGTHVVSTVYWGGLGEWLPGWYATRCGRGVGGKKGCTHKP